MEILFFCPRWGSENLPWNEFIARVKDAGYDGVECGIARGTDRRELDDIWNVAEKKGIRLIAQHYDTADADFGRHYDAYSQWLQERKEYPVAKINSQTGRDFFSFEQNKKLIDAAARFSSDTGIDIVHETHRHKWSFAAHVARAYLEKIPSLRITLDASHWVCVAESYLEDQPETMTLAIQRAGHIHARVGYPEGPQVTDPRAPEWETALQHHLRWWDAVVALHQKEKKETAITITPEFGPSPYMPALPYTRQPVVSQWEINAWMMDFLRRRYALK